MIFKLTSLETLGYMSVLFGSISIALVFWVVIELTNNKPQAFLAALILLFSGAFWFFAEHGEVYVPQLCFILFTVLLLIKIKPIPAGLFFLLSVSITPNSILALPALIYITFMKKYEKKQILIFLLPLFFISIFAFFYDIHRTLSIISSAIYSPKIYFKEFTFIELIKGVSTKLIKVYLKSFNIMFILALVGFVLLYKRERKLFILMVSFLLPFSLYIFNLGLLSGDHLIITFFVFTFLSAYVLTQIFNYRIFSVQIRHSIIIIFMFLHIWFSYQIFLLPEIKASTDLNRAVTSLSKEFTPNTILISNFSFGAAFWYLTQHEENYFLFSGCPNEYIKNKSYKMDKKIQRLQSKFWINISRNMIEFFSQDIKHKELFADRPLYLAVTSSHKQNIISGLFSTKQNPEILIKDKIKDFLEMKLETKIKLKQIEDSPMYKLYKIQTGLSN
jgi:hypothetical protein